MRRIASPLLILLLYIFLPVKDIFAQDITGNYLVHPIPTLAEEQSLSPQDALSSQHFSLPLYDKSQTFSNKVYWHKLIFPETSQKTAYLTLSNYLIDELDFYVFQGNQFKSHWARGAQQHWSPISGDLFGLWVPIPLSNTEQTVVLIRKHSGSPLLTPIALYSDTTIAKAKNTTTILWTVTVSCLLILLFHNIVVFLLFRYSAFIYYLSLNVVLILSLSIMMGFSHWLFSEALTQFFTRHLLTIFSIAAWSLYKFSIVFLEGSFKTSSRLRKWGEVTILLYVFVSLVLPENISALLFALIEIWLFFVCISWGIKALLGGFWAARFFLFSWGILLIGSLANSLLYWSILPFNGLTALILPACSILELLGFSFAFADRAKFIEQNRRIQMLTDSSTGLPNRLYYFSALQNLIDKRTPQNSECALVMINITSHATMSLAFGPAKSDLILRDTLSKLNTSLEDVSGILALTLPNGPTYKLMRITTARVAFISTNTKALTKQIQYVQDILNLPVQVNKIDFRHQYQIGSALYPSQSLTLDNLYQNALIACSQLNTYSENWQHFDPDLKKNHANHLRLLTLLFEDITHNALHFHIQPQVNLSSREIMGGEVLVRWHNSQLGPVSPAEFIPLAEQTGLIHKLTQRVLTQVFEWVSKYPHTIKQHRLSINISALDLLQEHFAEQVISLIGVYNLPPDQFTLEVTETTIFDNSKTVERNVHLLHKAGFQLSIDDFGAGYSSMQNLVMLKTNELKIDRQFVMNTTEDQQSRVLCQNMIQLSRDMKVTSVAEGIETEEVTQLLTEWKCDIGQGYHLYKPMPPDEYLALLPIQS